MSKFTQEQLETIRKKFVSDSAASSEKRELNENELDSIAGGDGLPVDLITDMTQQCMFGLTRSGNAIARIPRACCDPDEAAGTPQCRHVNILEWPGGLVMHVCDYRFMNK